MSSVINRYYDKSLVDAFKKSFFLPQGLKSKLYVGFLACNKLERLSPLKNYQPSPIFAIKA
jgi:hypothetical protein